MKRVALVKGNNRYANVRKALNLIEGDVKLNGVQKILVKPNFTYACRELATTHIDAVKALLDFLREHTLAKILIAESSGTLSESAMASFKKLGYFDLAKKYQLQFMDLNRDEPVTVQIFDSHLKPLSVKLAKTVVEADYRISICPPKTHDFVVITAALKNLVMGSVLRKENRLLSKLLALGNQLAVRFQGPSEKLATLVGRISGNDKIKVHQGYPAINLNLYKLAEVIPPHLSVIDGFRGMEGQGPVWGDEVDFRIAIASTDFLAADVLTARLMGFDPEKIGYLVYCQKEGLGEGNISKMNIVGEKAENCVKSFKPHPTYNAQLKWQIPNVEKYL